MRHVDYIGWSLPKTNKTICGIFSETQVAKGYENYRQLVAKTVLALGLGISANAQAQEENDPFRSSLKTPKEHVIAGVVIDETPTADYPSGIAALCSFFKENIIYPSDSVEGKVYVSLTIDTVGRVTNVRIKKSLSPLADAEVIRVVRLMVFKPAIINGKPVNSKISLPCSFSLGKND
ncbi:energy transducer TonB [Fluviicola taffensis]|uniref:TonB family protein n=1 Tax=Fluviicola taffensis (strain DSM 16823 / NCIMB 13979 / RW262) TaxID=755732 RepID=F2IAS3_FLUTR|nr:energy transducer TonB [Fluviicola taffensis]AEA44228.1 TonB family protein [Fluviicola taffensis DSM 16823]